MNITNNDLYKIREGIKKCANLVNVADINFTMTMARISSEVDNELKIIDKGRKEISDKYKEYLERHKEIDLKYTIQKEDGSLQLINDQLIIRDIKAYNIEISKLKLEFKEEVDKYDKIEKEFKEFLNQPCKVNISKLPKSLIPAQVNVEQMSLLFPIIE